MSDDQSADGRRLETRVPASAGWLGGCGALPFLGLAGAMPFLTGSTKLFATHALVAYGAVILSFLGGIHWGLAIGSAVTPPSGRLLPRLVLSVIPSLLGWIAVLIGGAAGLVILAIGVAAMLFIDLRATRLGQAPPWYPKFRIPLSLVVTTALIFGALA
jgi:hypothetical protein